MKIKRSVKQMAPLVMLICIMLFGSCFFNAGSYANELTESDASTGSTDTDGSADAEDNIGGAANGSISIHCDAQKGGNTSEDEFTFFLTLDDQDSTYECIKKSENGYETLILSAGTLTFTLKDGESLSCEGLVEGTGYSVSSPRKEGYSVTDTSLTRQIIKANTYHRITFYFSFKSVSLTTSITNGSITESQQAIPIGQSREITAAAAKGYHITKVLVNGIQIKDFSGFPITLSNLTEDQTVEVICEKDKEKPKPPQQKEPKLPGQKKPLDNKINNTISSFGNFNSSALKPIAAVDDDKKSRDQNNKENNQNSKQDSPGNKAEKENGILDKLIANVYIPGFGMSGAAAGIFAIGIISDIRLLRWCRGEGSKPERRKR